MIESGFALLLGLPLGRRRALTVTVMVAAISLPGWLMLALAVWLMLPGKLG